MEQLSPQTTVKRLEHRRSEKKAIQRDISKPHDVPIQEMTTIEDPESISSKAKVIQARVDELVRQFELSDNGIETDVFENDFVASPNRWKVGDLLLATHRGLTQTCDRIERNMLSAPPASDDRDVEHINEPASIQSTIESIDQVVHDAADKISTAKQMLLSTHAALHLLETRNAKLIETIRGCNAQEIVHERHVHELKAVLEGLHNERAYLLKHVDKSFHMNVNVAQVHRQTEALMWPEANDSREKNWEVHEWKIKAARHQRDLEEANECIQQLRRKVLELESINAELRRKHESAMQNILTQMETQKRDFECLQSEMETKSMQEMICIDTMRIGDTDASQNTATSSRRKVSLIRVEETSKNDEKILETAKETPVNKKPILGKNSERFQRHHKMRSSTIDMQSSVDDEKEKPQKAVVELHALPSPAKPKRQNASSQTISLDCVWELEGVATEWTKDRVLEYFLRCIHQFQNLTQNEAESANETLKRILDDTVQKEECVYEAKRTTSGSFCMISTPLASQKDSTNESFSEKGIVSPVSLLRAAIIALSKKTECKRPTAAQKDSKSDCLPSSLSVLSIGEESGAEKIQLAKAWMQRLIMRKALDTNHVICQVNEYDLDMNRRALDHPMKCESVPEAEFVLEDGLKFSSALMNQLKEVIPQLTQPLQLTVPLGELLFLEIVKYHKGLLLSQSASICYVKPKMDPKTMKETEILLPEVVNKIPWDTPYNRRKAAESLQKSKLRRK